MCVRFRMPVSPVSQVDMLGRVFVDTTETVSEKYYTCTFSLRFNPSISVRIYIIIQIRVEVLLELALASKRNVLLCGPHGGGKTTICRHFLQSRGINNLHVNMYNVMIMDVGVLT